MVPANTPRTAAWHSALPDGAPEWIQLTPAGTFSGHDGRGPYRLDDAAAVIAASMAAGKLAVDENHSTDLAGKAGQPAPARGWIVAMEARPDGLWGKVEWTPSGQALVADRAYRGISPVFTHTADGRVAAILRAALTNDPNLPLATLHHKDPASMKLDDLAKALGLPADADVPALVAGVAAMAAAHRAELDRVATAAGLAGGATAEALVTALQSRAAGAADEERKLRDTVVALQGRLDQMEAARASERATAFVDQAIRDGKPIRALRDHYIARHAKDAAAVEKEIGAMVSIHSGGIAQPPKAGSGSTGDLTPQALLAKAQQHRKEQAEAGVTLSLDEAVMAVSQQTGA